MELPSRPPEDPEPADRTIYQPPSDGDRTCFGTGSAPGHGEPTLPTVEDLGAHPPPCPPRYRLLTLLGQGGMGWVFKARDLQLQRLVALKFIRGEDPLLAQRLVLEARVLASLGHPNICQIFDVGEEAGQPYIAMQYIEGTTLTQREKELSIPAKAALMAEIAEALHAAHRKGLIHRDIKPDNIMVESLEEGGFHPILMDFGLALTQEEARPTLSAGVMGTLGFMAPEQARGEEALVDRRSDVYSLGATLYSVLLGHSPFPSPTTKEALRRLLEEDPKSMRKEVPSIPLDLDTITLKCLAKDPAKRYESALALAEDLRRFLRGEPILARPVGRLETLGKWMRRNPALTKTMAASLFLVLVLGGWGLGTYLRSRRLSEYATGFGAEGEKMAQGLRMAYLLPRHDLRPEKEWVRRRMDMIRARSQDAGGLALGPAAFALGQGHLALREFPEARRELEKAWSLGYRSSDVALALGRTLGELYRTGLEDLHQTTDPSEREMRKRQLENQLRDPALVLLRRASQERPEQRTYLEGILAFTDERYPEALARAREAFAQDPGLYEAKYLEGTALISLARAIEESKPDQSLKYLNEAATPLKLALDMARSDPDLLHMEGTRRLALLRHRVQYASDIDDAYKLTQEALDRALEADPSDGTIYDTKAMAGRALAFYQNTHGQDPFSTLDQTIAWCEQAAALLPGNASVCVSRGDALRFKAQALMQRGKDPRPEIERSIRSLEEAVRREPGDTQAHSRLATIRLLQAGLAMAAGTDVRAILDKGLLHAKEALRLNPKFAQAADVAGSLCANLAEVEASQGRDPGPFHHEALTYYQLAATNGPSYGLFLNDLADGSLKLALHLRRIGEPPDDALRSGLEAAEKSTRTSPDYLSLLTLGELLTVQAQTQMERGEDPSTALQKAREAFQKSESINASDYLTFSDQANLAIATGQADLRRGVSPLAAWKSARAFLLQAGRLNPTASEPPMLAGRLAWVWARWQAAKGQSPMAVLKWGEAELLKALSANPRYAELLALRGCLELMEADSTKGGSPAEILRQEGLKDLEQALAQNRFLSREFMPELEQARQPQSGKP